MNKKILIIISIVMITIMILCGCTDQKALTAGEESGKLKLKSNNVVELHRSSFNINTKLVYDRYTDETYEIIENIEVNYLFKNIAGRAIHIKVSAEFYDKNDRLVGIEESGFINLPEDYTEKAYTPQNSIIYSGSNVADVEYVLLIIEEIV